MQGACLNSCINNAIAGLGDDELLERFCGNGGAGVPGLVYPLPFNTGDITGGGGTFTVNIDPKNRNGAIPFAMLIDPEADEFTIAQIRDGNGDVVGLKGDGISTDWPLWLFQDAEIYDAGLNNLPPNIGHITSDRPMEVDVVNDATGDQGLTGVVWVVVPRM